MNFVNTKYENIANVSNLNFFICVLFELICLLTLFAFVMRFHPKIVYNVEDTWGRLGDRRLKHCKEYKNGKQIGIKENHTYWLKDRPFNKIQKNTQFVLTGNKRRLETSEILGGEEINFNYRLSHSLQRQGCKFS